jgi:RimJ/RimL family protein N-acetyltransferase
MEIRCEKSILRPWNLADAGALVSFADNPKIAQNLRDVFPSPYTIDDAKFFIEKIAPDANNLILAIEVGGQAIGAIGIYPQTDVYRKNAELGYWLGEPFWGKGIATDAVKTLVEYTFQHMDIYRIYAKVFETNKPSMRVLEKCGFMLEAILQKAVVKNNVLMDEYLYAVLSNK